MSDNRVIIENPYATEFDASQFDRVGAPITEEQRDAGSPGVQHEQQVKQRPTSLSDLAAEFTFFTPAVISAITPFDRDPVDEVLRACPQLTGEDRPYIIPSLTPFFSGLGRCKLTGADLNHRIYAVRHEHWEAVSGKILGIGILDRKQGYFARIGLHTLSLIDHFKLQKMSVVTTLPVVQLYTFAVSSNRSFAYLHQAVYPVLPTLVVTTPRPEMHLESQHELMNTSVPVQMRP